MILCVISTIFVTKCSLPMVIENVRISNIQIQIYGSL